MRPFAKCRRLHDLADGDQAGRLVRHLDADCRLAGDRRLDAQRRGRKREGQIVEERRDPLHLYTGTGLQLVLGHRRPGIDADHLARDAERFEGVFDDLDVALDLVGHALAPRGHGIEERDGGQLPFDLRGVVFGFGDDSECRLLPRFLWLLVRLSIGCTDSLGFCIDLPGAQRRGRYRRVGWAGRTDIFSDDRRPFRGSFRLLVCRRSDQSVQTPALGVCGLHRFHDCRDERTGTEMDGHDEADHERRHEEGPCPPPPRQADHGVVDRSPRGSARLCSEAE